MSLTNIEQVMPVKLAQALANPLFPALDSALRAGRHIGLDELDNHAFLMDFQDYLEEFYARYNVELIRAPEGFFYLRPRSTTLISRSVLSELDMMVGKILCYLYLSPERLANEGIFTQQELYDELLTLADESRLLKLDGEHIRFVFDCLQRNTTEIRNMKQYLLAVLYNAPVTMENHYASQVNHDLYGKAA